eukprot:CAMPEP_0118832606 /NCGR_PEP_ID=MMETSP1162-20130426/39352_1 /TAXON_ID=33656 /ORGANISM="Phaeocystis Sp, Strain CCMP2710" /LENGTH=66 /DNA_ID=CAMNT_0006764211 /DNA_START=91 /DNA_END=288 /DNA_ORIENTATION=-
MTFQEGSQSLTASCLRTARSMQLSSSGVHARPAPPAGLGSSARAPLARACCSGPALLVLVCITCVS